MPEVRAVGLRVVREFEDEPAMDVVELGPARVWTCNGCGRDQFERIPVREHGEVEKEFDGRMVPGVMISLQFPSVVRCKACDARYATEFVLMLPL